MARNGARKVNRGSRTSQSPKNTTESGGGYSKEQCKFMIMDDLDVDLVSPISIIFTVHKLGVSTSDLVEKEINIGETQALNLLKAALCSEMALTKALLKKLKNSAYTNF